MPIPLEAGTLKADSVLQLLAAFENSGERGMQSLEELILSSQGDKEKKLEQAWKSMQNKKCSIAS